MVVVLLFDLPIDALRTMLLFDLPTDALHMMALLGHPMVVRHTAVRNQIILTPALILKTRRIQHDLGIRTCHHEVGTNPIKKHGALKHILFYTKLTRA
jgi:hypothetical protein